MERGGEQVIFEAGQKLLFAGDSITDCGRRDLAVPYGDGYVSLVRAFLLARYPELNLTFVNRGISGDTTRDLAARWEKDVVAELPDWLSVMIGINDVWRNFGDSPGEAVPLPEYTSTMRRLLDRALQAAGSRLILMAPYMIERDHTNPMRLMMNAYSKRVRELAAEYQALFVDTQAAFDAVLDHSDADAWADDNIHPNPAGHAVIALAFLRAVGFTL